MSAVLGDSETAAAAALYLAAGWSLCRLKPNSKQPDGADWPNNPTTSPDAFATRGIGIIHKLSGTCCLDIDDLVSAQAWFEVHGIDLDTLLWADDAVQIQSGKPNRAKLLYRAPAGEHLPYVKLDAAGIELRGNGTSGHQDVLPPSIHPETGKAYEWGGEGDWKQLPEVPAALLQVWKEAAAARASAGAKTSKSAQGGRIGAGSRNDMLSRKAYAMRRNGLEPGEIEAALHGLNERLCDPPLARSEVSHIARGKAIVEPEAEPETFDDLQAASERMGRKDRPGPMIERIAAARLERGDEDALLRQLKEQVGGRLRDFRADIIARKKNADGAVPGGAGEEVDHLQIAEKIADRDDLVFAQTFFWGFNPPHGVWERVDDPEIKGQIAKVCREVGQPVVHSRVNGAFELAKAHFFRKVEFDCGGRRDVCAANGVLTYRSGQGWTLTPYRREDYRRVRLQVAYDPTAQAPRFEQFLAEIFAQAEDGAERALAALEFIGLALIQSCEFEKALFAVGPGGNGKSVYLGVIEAMVGYYRAAVSLSQLDNRFQRAHLDGKLVNLVSEIPIGAELPDAALKALISGEPITAEHKMRPPFEFRPTATFIFATNHLPNIRDFSDGLFRRLLVLRFDRSFKDKPDTRLGDTLRGELSGILNLALGALGDVFERGSLTIPPSSVEAVQGWREDSDQVRMFVEDACEPDSYARLTTAELFKLYMDWAATNRQRHTLGRRSLVDRVVALGYPTARVGRSGSRGVAGLRPRYAR